jgi:S-adenosylmethionine synthetase
MSDFSKLNENIKYLNNILKEIVKKNFGLQYVEIMDKLYLLSLKYQRLLKYLQFNLNF